MKNSLFLFIVVFLFLSSCVFTKEDDLIVSLEALKIANNLEPIKNYIARYNCDGCNPSYKENKKNLIGCVEYDVKEQKNEFVVEYWVSAACHSRYGWKDGVKSSVRIDKKTGRVNSISPDPAFIESPFYCQSDADCYCMHGSGVEFRGCSNFFHAPSTCCGEYKCEKCSCIENICTHDRARASMAAYKALKSKDIDPDKYYPVEVKEMHRDGREVWNFLFEPKEKLTSKIIPAGGGIAVEVDKMTRETVVRFLE